MDSNFFQNKEMHYNELGVVLEDFKYTEKAKVYMEDQGHSGMSWSLVCAMIKEFCIHGEEFVMWLNKK